MTEPASNPAATEPAQPLAHLQRIRWAVRATLVLGVAASVAANVLHAQSNPVSQVIAAWPPLALLLTVELISRIPVHRRSLAAVRLGATTAIAGIAAWVSYWHMAGVVARYGETGASQYLYPFSVDGLVVVASVSLVELAGRIAEAERAIAALVEPTQANPVPEPATEPQTRTRRTAAPRTRSANPTKKPTRTRTQNPTGEPTAANPDGNPTAAPAGEPANLAHIDSRSADALMPRVHEIVADHLDRTGKPPTRHELRSALRVKFARTEGLIERALVERQQKTA